MEPLPYPVDVPTYSADGRAALGDLYSAVDALTTKHGWSRQEVVRQTVDIDGKKWSLPIFLYRSPSAASSSSDRTAIYLIAGIHGEEPAGPNAIARSVDSIDSLSKSVPVFLLPMCNPSGYSRNWRYPDAVTVDMGGHSVGDSSSILLNETTGQPRDGEPFLNETKMITETVLNCTKERAPLMSLDLHEDCLDGSEGNNASYVYSQGPLGYSDLAAKKVVQLLADAGLPTLKNGKTRFGEDVIDGICSPSSDGSIDEMLSAKQVWQGGVIQGPAAHTVLVVETPGKIEHISKRIAAQESIVKSLPDLYKLVQ